MNSDFQKGVYCIKCNKVDCIPFPDEEEYTICVYCGASQNIRYAPVEPIDYKIVLLSCGHLFAEECECSNIEGWLLMTKIN